MFNTQLLLLLFNSVVLAVALPVDQVMPLDLDEIGDFEMYVVQKGGQRKISVVSEEGEYVIENVENEEEEIDIEKPANEYVCIVRGIEEYAENDRDCTERILVADNEVPQSVVEECDGRPIYTVKSCDVSSQEEMEDF